MKTGIKITLARDQPTEDEKKARLALIQFADEDKKVKPKKRQRKQKEKVQKREELKELLDEQQDQAEEYAKQPEET